MAWSVRCACGRQVLTMGVGIGYIAEHGSCWPCIALPASASAIWPQRCAARKTRSPRRCGSCDAKAGSAARRVGRTVNYQLDNDVVHDLLHWIGARRINLDYVASSSDSSSSPGSSPFPSGASAASNNAGPPTSPADNSARTDSVCRRVDFPGTAVSQSSETVDINDLGLLDDDVN